MADLPATTSKPLGEDHDGNLLIRWPHEYLRQHGGLVHSYGESTPALNLWVLSVWESECVKGADMIGKTFAIEHAICGPATFINEESGEEADGIRTLFLGPNHPPIAFSAKAAWDAIGKLTKAIGHGPPWDPPVMVLLKQVAARGARRTYRFIPQIEAP